jgi:hypothetical protein
MRIAFDLDNTLIRCGYDFPLEQPTRRLWAKLLGGEPLRLGVVAVAEYCQQRQWEVWVYTTSYRNHWYIRKLFWLHGIRVAGVINQHRHNQEVTVRCTKHPPTFNIDLLIDDSEGVRLEGEKHGFRTLVIQPQDTNWEVKVRAELEEIERSVATQ